MIIFWMIIYGVTMTAFGILVGNELTKHGWLL